MNVDLKYGVEYDMKIFCKKLSGNLGSKILRSEKSWEGGSSASFTIYDEFDNLMSDIKNIYVKLYPEIKYFYDHTKNYNEDHTEIHLDVSKDERRWYAYHLYGLNKDDITIINNKMKKWEQKLNNQLLNQ
jgi:hypothetical protein